MKIAFFSPHIENFGDTTSIPKLANGLASAGHEVDVLRAWNEWDESVFQGGVNLVNLKSRRFVPFLPSIDLLSKKMSYRLKMAAISIGMLPGLIRYLRRRQPDILIARMLTVSAVLGVTLSRSSTKLILATGGVPTGSRFQKLVWPRLYPRAKAHVACASSIADVVCDIAGMEKGQHKIIPDIIVDESIEELAGIEINHPWFPKTHEPNEHTDDPPVIVSVGRLTRQKDFPTLIKAFAKTREKTDCRLLIIGEGEKRAELERLTESLGVSEYVQMPGFIKNPWRYMRAADLFVLSSLWEGVGHALVEAQALGTPIVSTDCPAGQREVLLDGAAGRLVPVGDVEKMAEAILEAISGDSKTDMQVQAGLDASERYTPSRVIEAWDSFVRTI